MGLKKVVFEGVIKRVDVGLSGVVAGESGIIENVDGEKNRDEREKAENDGGFEQSKARMSFHIYYYSTKGNKKW